MRRGWWVAVLRWPLWSWRRLTVTVLGALLLAWAAGVAQSALAGGGTTSDPAAADLRAGSTAAGSAGSRSASGSSMPSGSTVGPSAGPSAGSGAGSAAGLTAATSSGLASAHLGSATAPTGPIAAPVRGPASAAARRFVLAWARPDLPAGQWFSGLSALCTPRLSGLLSRTDPARVPATRVLDPVPTATADPSPVPVGGAVDVAVSTDAGRVIVHLVATRSGWLADAISPDAQPPPGVPTGSAGG